MPETDSEELASTAKPSLARRARLPRLSGKESAAWLGFCFVLTALLIPSALRLPMWVEFEIVVTAWWAIWLGVLTRLLYTGRQVTDDHRFGEPRNWIAAVQGDCSKKFGNSWWGGMADALCFGDAEGCLFIFSLVILFVLVWFLFEVAVPLVVFFLYTATRGMLARVVNDRHHCRGALHRALAWGFVWATLYVGPLASVVWFVHYVQQ